MNKPLPASGYLKFPKSCQHSFLVDPGQVVAKDQQGCQGRVGHGNMAAVMGNGVLAGLKGNITLIRDIKTSGTHYSDSQSNYEVSKCTEGKVMYLIDL